MRHLEDVGRVELVLVQHPPLDLLFHVAAEQEARAGRSARGAPASRYSWACRRERSPARARARRSRPRRKRMCRRASAARSGPRRFAAAQADLAPMRAVRRRTGPQLPRAGNPRSGPGGRRCGPRARATAPPRPGSGCRGPKVRRHHVLADIDLRPRLPSEDGMPPPSTSMRLPVRKDQQMLSPCPTSIAVISSCPARDRGANGCHSSRPRRATASSRPGNPPPRPPRHGDGEQCRADIATPSHTGGVGIRQCRLHRRVPVHHLLRNPQQSARQVSPPSPSP